MPSSSQRRALRFAGILLTAMAAASSGGAQPQQAQGFAIERLYLSPPEGGWVVMDALDMHGRLGGAVSLTSGYALRPLRVADGNQHDVVSNDAFTDFGFAITCDRFRLDLNLDMPLVISGQSGTQDGYQFTAPYHLDPGSTTSVPVNIAATPDRISDARIGFDARLLGDATSPFRLGASAQLFVSSGERSEYDTDGTYRAMFRALFAGDVGLFTYAGQVGVHVRPLDDAPIPGSPQGSELLFGAAAGARFAVDPGRSTVLVVGPEIYGETAFRSFLGSSATGLEGLLTGRIEGTREDGPQLRFKLGTGGGINRQFGAPEWRIVFGVEVSDRRRDRRHKDR
jgi:hypothetical protein